MSAALVASTDYVLLAQLRGADWSQLARIDLRWLVVDLLAEGRPGQHRSRP